MSHTSKLSSESVYLVPFRKLFKKSRPHNTNENDFTYTYQLTVDPFNLDIANGVDKIVTPFVLNTA